MLPSMVWYGRDIYNAKANAAASGFGDAAAFAGFDYFFLPGLVPGGDGGERLWSGTWIGFGPGLG